MSNQSSRSDLLQIFIFTFFLCAVFFGAWGAYLKFFKVAELEGQRRTLNNDVTWIEKKFAEPKSREIVSNDIRRKQLEAQSKGRRLDQAIEELIGQMPASGRPTIAKADTERDDKARGGLFKVEGKFEFQPTKLKYIMNLLQSVENDTPFYVTKVRVTRRRQKKGENLPEIWTTDDFRLVNYVPADTGKKKEPAE